ncbi:hypothetical protein GCM10027020_27160 [Nocardioides salsibiostraticola]
MDRRPSDIAPPPSLDDILSATPDTRLGRVDFTQRLSRDVAAGSGARSGGPGFEPTREHAPEAEAEAEAEAGAGAQDRAETEAEDVADVVPTPKVEAATERPSPVAPLRSAERRPTSQGGPSPEVGGVDLDNVGQSVDDVAASVIARMREAGEASRRHLESIEAEAARRCELLTAQAELDAELIRLHARREAHAIITAARMRAGSETGPTSDSERLNQIGESFSRFAESIETAVAESPQAPDHPLRP